jgi:hypothetical protein
MKAPSQKQLDKWLKEWQNILRLQDWDIRIRLVKQPELVREGIEGESQVQQTNKTGSIRILHPDEYNARWKPGTQNIERVLVHELLHFHLDGLDVPESRHRELEQAIECIEPALTALHHMVKQASKS